MERAEFVASKAGDLPVLPEIATKVIELSRQPDESGAELERVISSDVALSAKVLRIANSALFGMSGTVSTLKRAILVLGSTTLRSVVVVACTESLYRSRNSAFPPATLWEHALATAIAARSLGLECGFRSTDETFLAGLLHDVGKPILDRNLGARYLTVVKRAVDKNESLRDAEREMLEFDHAEVGGLVMKRWNMAPSLQDAVRWHHEPQRAAGHRQLCALTSLANGISSRLDPARPPCPERDRVADESARLLGLDAERVERVSEGLAATLAAERDLLVG